MREADAGQRPRIAVTMGDPGGIGPEVIVKALADAALRRSGRFLILGPEAALRKAAELAGLDRYWASLPKDRGPETGSEPGEVTVIDYPLEPAGIQPRDTAEQGRLSFQLVEDAIGLARRDMGDPLRMDGVVTGPISKHAWKLAGHGDYPGHTELFAQRLGAQRHGMMFVTTRPPHLRVILATAHIPLMQVGAALTTAHVLQAIELGAEACQRLGIPRPRIAVCGLNPHAGEQGLLGDEDRRVIEPAIRAAAGAGIDARGPYPADTIFNAALRGDFDLVVAMYHDQGLIPVKLLARDSAVNVTVGLPIVRTSPDHGTAFDIAGQNRADPGSMHAAIELAVKMVSAS